MKRKKKIAVITVLLLVIFSSVVYAQLREGQVSVWFTDNVGIIVNGNRVGLPEGMHVIYHQEENRYYVPARLVAEELGAEVDWDEFNRSIIITKEPEVVEPEIIYIPAEDPEAAKIEYVDAPVRLKQDNFQLDVHGITNSGNFTSIFISIANHTSSIATIDYKNAYLIVGGAKYYGMPGQADSWGDGLSPYSEIKDRHMNFDRIPSGRRAMTLVIPVFIDRFVDQVGQTTLHYELKVDVRFNDSDL